MSAYTGTVHTAQLPQLAEVIGQRTAVERLKVAVAAAKADDRSLDHFLLTGPGGVGKTSLTQIVAAEMGVQFGESLASALNDGGLASFLLDAADKQVLFIDEVHELASENMTLAYRALSERKLFLPGGRKTRALPLPAFTLIAATTDPHNLPPSFRDRFTELPLDFYTAEELAAIVRQRAAAMNWEADPHVFDHIGRLGRGIPRLAIRLLVGSREVCRSRTETVILVEHFERACELEDRDRGLGLDRVERHLLTLLHEADGPVRLNVLAARLGLSSRTVVMHEGFLIRAGLVMRTEHGRVITAEGIEYVRKNEKVAGVTMPSINPDGLGNARSRSVYSIAEVARMCGLSRARFYDLIGNGVMPPPVYDVRTRRPMYTVELAARSVEVRETNIGFDGRYTLFYERRQPPAPTAAVQTPTAPPSRRRQAILDPLVQEMIESLRATGVQRAEGEIVEAIQRRCPQGLTEARFELDLVLLRGDLVRPSSG
ncbi:MAG: Holliday junction DNA helicase RuvB C-terminal domain-containing protein [Tepidisphaeraceae bacterium]